MMHSAFSIDNVFGDHMVLQRNRPIRVSGSAPRGMPVTVSLGGGIRSAICTAGEDSRWCVELEPMAAGGPFTLSVSTQLCLRVLTDILIGDVWICSGQSNMEYPLCGTYQFYHLPEGEEVASAACDDGLRLLSVTKAVSPDMICDDITFSPGWRAATSRDAVAAFSSVGFLFGQELRKRLGEGVPIGLIDSSWGGSRIEPWISLEGLETAGVKTTLEALKKRKANYEKGLAEGSSISDNCYGGDFKEWIETKFRTYAPEATAEAKGKWNLPSDRSPEWKDCSYSDIPGRIMDVGVYWMRCTFRFPAGHKGESAVIHFDHVDDYDEVFLDGEKVGEMSPFTLNYWMLPRDYSIKITDDGEALHTITVRLENHYCSGTFTGNAAIMNDNSALVNLTDAPWQTRTEYTVDSEKIGIRPQPCADGMAAYLDNQIPTTLFNAMVSPATKMNIKGAIWYQGCSNASEWSQYGALQAALIEDWRRAWRDPSMPFISTQLSGFWRHCPEARGPEDFWKAQNPADTEGYAPIREVQQSFLDYSNSGVACTIDIGDAYDIHPPRKRPVAERLANEAMRLVYGDLSAKPGPRGIKAIPKNGVAVEITVDDAGDGLCVEGGAIGPHLVAVMRESGKVEWADAQISEDGKSIVVFDGDADRATGVQYAFSAFAPGPFVKRKGDGLPLFPFRLAVDATSC